MRGDGVAAGAGSKAGRVRRQGRWLGGLARARAAAALPRCGKTAGLHRTVGWPTCSLPGGPYIGLPCLQSSRAAHQEALAKEEAARRAAEQLVAEERAQRQRMLAAAASGNLPLLAAAGGSGGLATPGGAAGSGTAAGSPGLSPGGEAAAAAAAGLTATELYSKYVEMHERYRSERLKNRQQEIVMEELCSEVEKRAALVKEQQVGAGGSGELSGVDAAQGPTGRMGHAQCVRAADRPRRVCTGRAGGFTLKWSSTGHICSPLCCLGCTLSAHAAPLHRRCLPSGRVRAREGRVRRHGRHPGVAVRREAAPRGGSDADGGRRAAERPRAAQA